MFELDHNADGVLWLSMDDKNNSVIVFARFSASQNVILVCCNFTPQVLYDYAIGVPKAGKWVEIFNSDDSKYGGSGVGLSQPVVSMEEPLHYQPFSIRVVLPPLSVIYLQLEE